ncbi:hypothetical protein A3K70_00180 [Candidatus Bathyarchaeota archaeon RBG_16_48_13]|nr:MAG: hypothetical protein A3K70_00180 [Candidatus Bathyarchaeota archaeon RBG_16_48_13]
MADNSTAESVSNLFKVKGFANTSQWMDFAIQTGLPNLEKDLGDIFGAFKNEIGSYKNEYYDNSDFKKQSFEIIFNIVLGGILSDATGFRKATEQHVSTIQKIIETNKLLEDIIEAVKSLEGRPRFFLLFFYYLIIWEGTYKSVRANLLSFKNLRKNSKQKDLPDILERGIHRNLRNSIAHTNFKYYDKEKKMEFWDRDSKGEFTLNPIRMNYEEFSRYLLEVNLFCEIFGFTNLLMIGAQDIINRKEKRYIHSKE